MCRKSLSLILPSRSNLNLHAINHISILIQFFLGIDYKNCITYALSRQIFLEPVHCVAYLPAWAASKLQGGTAELDPPVIWSISLQIHPDLVPAFMYLWGPAHRCVATFRPVKLGWITYLFNLVEMFIINERLSWRRNIIKSPVLKIIKYASLLPTFFLYSSNQSG